MSSRARKIDKAALFLLPSLFGFLIFYALPAVYSLKYAFTDSPVGGSFIWFDNFMAVFASEAFRLAAVNTCKFIAVSLPLSMGIALLLALLIETLEKRRTLTTLFMSPLVIPTACAAFLFRSLFSSNGLLSNFSGEELNWLETDSAFAIAVAIYIWKNIGYNLCLYIAGLANIPTDYYEWAAMEGMGKIRFFFLIRLRYLMPTLFIVFVMSFINSFKIFRELYMLAGDYPQEGIYMLQHYMNNQFGRMNYANLTVVSFLLTAVVSIIVFVFFRADRDC